MSAGAPGSSGSGGPRPIGMLLVAGLALAAALAALVFGLRLLTLPASSNGGKDEASLPRLGKVPPFSLTSEQGKTVTRESFAGNVWVADFIFVRCGGTCPQMSTRMASLAHRLAGEPRVRFVSFDVDPDHDTVEALAGYATRYGAARSRWSFLRGEKPVIRELARHGFKLAIEDAAPDSPEPILHSTRFVLVDGAGEIRGYYDGLDGARVDALVSDVRALAREGPVPHRAASPAAPEPSRTPQGAR